MKPRILFLGSPESAVPSLRAAAEIGEVVAVVTQPDRPAGRGRKLTPPPAAEAARTMGIPVLQPAKIRTDETRTAFAAHRPDVLLVVAYGRILPPPILGLAPHGCVNVHFSLLPRWRGASPVARAILAGDAETGVSLMVLDEGLDTGPVFASAATAIGAEDTAGALTERLAAIGADLVRHDLPRFLAGGMPPGAQPADGATLAPVFEKADGLLRWNLPAAEVHRRIRAVTPWPGAFGFLAGTRLRIHRARLLPHVASPGPGTIATEARRLAVGCADACVEVLEIQREGGRRTDAAAFLAGFPIAPGARFGEGGGS